MFDVTLNAIGDDGETALGESWNANSPRLERRNLLKQPRLVGVSGSAWTIHDRVTAVAATGHDGTQRAWTLSGLASSDSVYQEPENRPNGKASVFSVYVGVLVGGVKDPRIRISPGDVGFCNYSLDRATGKLTEIFNPIVAKATSEAFSSAFWRVSVEIPALTWDSSASILFSYLSETVIDAPQLETGLEVGSSATAFVDPELFGYNEQIMRILVCDRCGFPCTSYPPKLTKQDGALVCPKCLDKV